MLHSRKTSLIIIFCLTYLLLAFNFVKAADVIGCCTKNQKDANNNPIKYTDNLTEADCKKINYATTSWEKDKRANNNECIKKTSTTPTSKPGEKTTFTPQISIPDSEFTAGNKIELPDNAVILTNYIIAYFKYFIGIIGMIAAVVLMFAGVRWLTAAGNQTIIADAKKYIISSLSGLALTLGAFLLLATVNTNLIELKAPGVARIQYIPLGTGCCLKPGSKTETTTRFNCEKITNSKDAFIEDFVAYNNTCVPNNGCCIVVVYKKQIPTGERICYENKSQATCQNESSGWFKILISGGILGAKEYKAIYAAPLTCKEDVATIKANACTEIK